MTMDAIKKFVPGARAYHYEAQLSGVVITRLKDGATVFLQTGDDAGQFWDQIDASNDLWTEDDVCAEYFS